MGKARTGWALLACLAVVGCSEVDPWVIANDSDAPITVTFRFYRAPGKVELPSGCIGLDSSRVIGSKFALPTSLRWGQLPARERRVTSADAATCSMIFSVSPGESVLLNLDDLCERRLQEKEAVRIARPAIGSIEINTVRGNISATKVEAERMFARQLNGVCAYIYH